jgi:sugar phosphate isomerase/epimerase
MYKNLSIGAIGIRGMTLADTIQLAAATGFAGIDFSIQEAAEIVAAHDLDYLRSLFAGAGVLPGQWGLPVAWRDDARWEQDLQALPRLADLGQALGCTRTATWCPSASDALPFEENLRWHADRFRPIAAVLKAHDCRLGLEFIGPETMRAGKRYPFIYTLEGMMELAEVIGTGNVGLLLDAWHLYTSGGSVEDLDQVSADDIVTVHINDAPAGVPLNAQVDNLRCLPLETGVIDLPGFMRKLAELQYDGPVTTEPFSQALNELAARDPRAAALRVSAQMDKLWDAAALPKP